MKFFVAHAEAIIALAALFVSVLAIWQSSESLEMQRIHNAKSLLPIPTINRLTYLDKIGVELENRGVGPLRIVSLEVYRRSNLSDRKSSIIDWMPPLQNNLIWSDFRRGLGGSTLQPEKLMNLILLKGPATPDFITNRDIIKSALGELDLRLVYRDVYENEFVLEESLSVFAN